MGKRKKGGTALWYADKFNDCQRIVYGHKKRSEEKKGKIFGEISDLGLK